MPVGLPLGQGQPELVPEPVLRRARREQQVVVAAHSVPELVPAAEVAVAVAVAERFERWRGGSPPLATRLRA